MLFVVALPPLFFCSFQAAAAADPEGIRPEAAAGVTRRPGPGSFSPPSAFKITKSKNITLTRKKAYDKILSEMRGDDTNVGKESCAVHHGAEGHRTEHAGSDGREELAVCE